MSSVQTAVIWTFGHNTVVKTEKAWGNKMNSKDCEFHFGWSTITKHVSKSLDIACQSVPGTDGRSWPRLKRDEAALLLFVYRDPIEIWHLNDTVNLFSAPNPSPLFLCSHMVCFDLPLLFTFISMSVAFLLFEHFLLHCAVIPLPVLLFFFFSFRVWFLPSSLYPRV